MLVESGRSGSLSGTHVAGALKSHGTQPLFRNINVLLSHVQVPKVSLSTTRITYMCLAAEFRASWSGVLGWPTSTTAASAFSFNLSYHCQHDLRGWLWLTSAPRGGDSFSP